MEDELILCVPVDRLLEYKYNPYGISEVNLISVIEYGVWKPRKEVETDYNFKQIIPYVVFVKDGKILVYDRTEKAEERRLRKFSSLGFGGHVRYLGKTSTLRDSYSASLRRELIEEVGYTPDKAPFLGILNDDTTKVGRVHCGILHACYDPPDLEARDDELENLRWMEPDKINENSLEPWSFLVIRAHDKFNLLKAK